MDKVKVYMLIDLIFTPLYEPGQWMDVNTSKSIWVRMSLLSDRNNKLLYPTFVLAAATPFVVRDDGLILKCTYDKRLEGVQIVTSEFDYLESLSMEADGDWDWEKLTNKHTAYNRVTDIYGSMDGFRRYIKSYPSDNTLLRSLLADAKLEL
jgi:hypothetical protein